MIFCPSDTTLYLVELSELVYEPIPTVVHQSLAPLTQIAEWARGYLCNSHADLGRRGHVCPYVQAAINKKLFFMTVRPGPITDPAEISTVVMNYRDWFLELEPRESDEALLKTILILFPDIPANDAVRTIDATQAHLKPEFVAKGLMIGEFHAGPPDKAGLWNPLFRPLFSPIPMLVIRHMAPTDFPFLKDDKQSLAAYLNVFGEQVPHHLKHLVREAALQLNLAHHKLS